MMNDESRNSERRLPASHSSFRVAVILPTYNELANLKRIVHAILAADDRIDVIVVDDDSPDGTGHVADKLARQESRVHVIHRYKSRGRGLAGIAGFRFALEHGYDYAIEMDADFSHDPRHLPELLRYAPEYDVVIGSRGVRGGVDVSRGAGRRFVTRGAWLYLQLLLGVRRVADPTSGYRCFSRTALRAIRIDALRSRGPAIVSEVLFRCRGMRIKEIPIKFRDRERGESKFNFRAMWDSLLQAVRLRITGK